MSALRTRRMLVPALASVALLASACGYSSTPLPTAASSSSSPPSSATCTTTDKDLESYAPNRSTNGPAVQAIKKRGVLRVGVSWDTNRMGARNGDTNSISGFDIDIARAIAAALGVRAELHVISAKDRIPDLQHDVVDVVVRAFTINCDRWTDIAFSGEYYHAAQKVLVRKDLADKYHGPSDLAGLNVCAPSGTTSFDNIKKIESKANPVTAANHTGCLMLLQQGRADAITGDDTVLAGLAAQDPYAYVPPGQKPLEDEPYGVGVKSENKDLVSFVNAVLLQYEHDGSWKRSYDKWLKPYLHVDAKPPTMRFGRS